MAPIGHEAYALHEALVAWLTATHPRANPHAVLAALSYEQARIIAALTEPGDVDVDGRLRGVQEVMRAHIAAYRAGLRF